MTPEVFPGKHFGSIQLWYDTKIHHGHGSIPLARRSSHRWMFICQAANLPTPKVMSMVPSGSGYLTQPWKIAIYRCFTY